MSFNTFGHMFRVTTFGESHGPAIGCVVDGCPPRIPLTENDIQPYLDKRRPGQSRFTTQPRAGPWLSPKVVTRKRWPKVLWDMGDRARMMPRLRGNQHGSHAP